MATKRRAVGGGASGSRIPAVAALGGDGVLAGLNITPMIDVMLALLIIFMVVTPVLTEYTATPPVAIHVRPETLEDAITLGIDAHGTYYLGADSVPAAELPERLRVAYAARPGDHLLYVRADRSLQYHVVLDAIAAARAAGVRTVGAISEPRADLADSARAHGGSKR